MHVSLIYVGHQGNIWDHALQIRALGQCFFPDFTLRQQNHSTTLYSSWRLNSFLTIMCAQPCFTISKLIQEAYFSWYMPQASCYYGKSNYWSAMLLGFCMSYTSTLTCITNREHIFSHPEELQVKLLHVFCLGYLLSSHAKYAIDLNVLYV